MTVELKVPAVGESITEVEIGDWLKAEGASVAQDETLAVIETEKATVELPAPAAGWLTKILKPTGATAKVGEVIGLLEAGKSEPASAPTAPAAPTPSPDKPSAARTRATPLAEKVLAEHGLRADEVSASGPGGRVSKADVLRHVEQHQGAHRPSHPRPAWWRRKRLPPPLPSRQQLDRPPRPAKNRWSG